MAKNGNIGSQKTGNTALEQPAHDKNQSLDSKACVTKVPLTWPSKPIPYRIVAYKSHGSGTIYLHDGDKEDSLFGAEVHTGYSGSGLLGFIPGIVHFDGMTKNERFIATTGYKSLWNSRIYSFSVQSALKLSPLDYTNSPTAMTTEIMRAHTSSEHGLAFQFSIEIGDEGSPQRESFEWIKPKKNTCEVGSGKGFKLMRLVPPYHQTDSIPRNWQPY
jgi:hypothetical protein